MKKNHLTNQEREQILIEIRRLKSLPLTKNIKTQIQKLQQKL